jgi:hypothetical protein
VPHAELLLGCVTAIDAEQRTARVETPEAGVRGAWDLLLALGIVVRTLPIPARRYAVGFKDLPRSTCAIACCGARSADAALDSAGAST